MNRPTFIAAALLTTFALSPAQAGFEALKAADLSAVWQAARQAAPPPPEVIAGAAVPTAAPAVAAGHTDHREIRRFNRGGFTFESEAATAVREAEGNLRQAGIAVLASRVTRQSDYPWKYGLEIEYFANGGPYDSDLRIETYTGGSQTFESNARAEMQRTVANLRAAGETVILGLVVRQENYPWNYHYTVDFLRRDYHRPDPRPRVEVYESGVYYNLALAKNDFDRAVRAFERQGRRIVEGRIYDIHRAGHPSWYFVIRHVDARYGEPGGHPGPGYPPGHGRPWPRR